MPKVLFQNHLGKQLKEARKAQRLTQAQLALKARLSIPTVQVLERGQGNLSSWHNALVSLGLELAGRSLPLGATTGTRIASLRKRRGLSQRELSAIVGTTPTTLLSLERHSRGRLPVLNAVLIVLAGGAYLAPPGSVKAYYTHAGVSSVHHGWHTPEELLQQLYGVFGRFDLDPCSPTRSRRAAPVKARVHYTVEDDGLSLPWFGSVFVNPPYGGATRYWTAKARQEVAQGNASIVVALLPSRTDASYWHEDIFASAHVFFFRGRLHFGTYGPAAPFPSALVVWGATPSIITALQEALPNAWHYP